MAYTFLERIYAVPMPVCANELDLVAIRQELERVEPEFIIMEKVASRPNQSSVSMFRFGEGFGALKGLAAGLNISLRLVTPQAWKKVVLAGTPKDKEAAIRYCKQVFPEVSLLATERSRVPHDGIADALCILDYATRTF